MAARFVEMVPVPPSRIEHLSDGDTFDLGNGERLKIIFSPGHQPSGIVILEEKNKGLFIKTVRLDPFPHGPKIFWIHQVTGYYLFLTEIPLR
jgi:hypothetical protein